MPGNRARLERVFARIDEAFPAAVEDLSQLCSFQSTRDNREGTLACADWLKARLERVGATASLLSAPGGYPLVYAGLDGQSGRRLLYSNHYDVEGAGDQAAWDSSPFAPVVRDGGLYGRGTSDNKGSILSRLLAVEAVLASEGALPCGVVFAIEAKTHIFAPHFEQVVASNLDLFRADACLWENALNGPDGRPTLRLGDKGIVALELTIERQPKRPLSSMVAAVVPGSAWELIWALAALRPLQDSPPEWFMDGTDPLTAAEEALLDQLPSEPPGQPLLIPDPIALGRRLRNEPIMNLSAVNAGRPPTTDAPLTSIPGEATAYIDLRLLPGQDPDRIIDALTTRVHEAVPHASVTVLGKLRPHRTPMSDPFVAQLGRAARFVWGADPLLEPLSTSSGSRHGIAQHFDIPIVGTGIAYPGSAIQRPNEHARLDDFRNGIKFMAALLFEFGSPD